MSGLKGLKAQDFVHPVKNCWPDAAFPVSIVENPLFITFSHGRQIILQAKVRGIVFAGFLQPADCLVMIQCNERIIVAQGFTGFRIALLPQ